MSSFPKEKREKKKASFKSGGGKMQGFGQALGCAGIAILIGAEGGGEPLTFGGFFTISPNNWLCCA
ncbi:hypothetical protein [Ekhidna sp.]|uniref:hypothetical protein n=1 Tax=Ekhidna sp. TaxID=2608089 RepID=UPI003CCBD0DF